jgi:hypothetical protein
MAIGGSAVDKGRLVSRCRICYSSLKHIAIVGLCAAEDMFVGASAISEVVVLFLRLFTKEIWL